MTSMKKCQLLNHVFKLNRKLNKSKQLKPIFKDTKMDKTNT